VEGRTQGRSTGLFLAAAAAMIILTLVSAQPWAAGARSAARSGFAPISGVLARADPGGLAAVFGDIRSLRDQNRLLAGENSRLRRQLAELQGAARENQDLRRALDFERAYGRRMLAAEVIGRGPDSFSRTLTIDRGELDGVRVGMVVASGAGLVGRVREVGPHVAVVQTLADPLSRVNAYTVTSGLDGTVIGGPGGLLMEIEPRLGVGAAAGEWALTSGVGGLYPRGLLIGQVARVYHRDTATAEQALLAWVNDPAGLWEVLVITDFLPT